MFDKNKIEHVARSFRDKGVKEVKLIKGGAQVRSTAGLYIQSFLGKTGLYIQFDLGENPFHVQGI